MEAPRRHRVRILTLVVFALGAVVGLRLYQLQIVASEDLRDRARRQSQRQVEVTAPRGSIIDRHGRELAVSLDTESLIVHPWLVEDPLKAARLLAPVIGRSQSWILEQLRFENSRWLKRFMEPDTVAAVRRLDLPVGGGQPLEFLPESKRYYPRGRLGVHVIGFTNIDGVGIEGIEKQFDEQLRGDTTVYVVLHDARNERLQRDLRAPGRKPRTVVLTLDMVLQHLVERELDGVMRGSGAKAASAVLLDPRSGQILALANRPAADPNNFGQSRPEARLNRAVVHEYEPGSTFKLVSMAAALEYGAVRPGQRFDCEGGRVSYRGREIRDLAPNGVLSAQEILQKSSNIGMAKIVQALPPMEFHDSIVRFGFGSRTGVELPGERLGTVRPIAQWNGYSQASLSFGQEIGVTVLQMAVAFAAIANDGVLVPPRIVLDAQDPGGQRVVSSRTARELTSMLESVITDGTGTRAQVPGYRLAGKSGTAQRIVDGKYSSTEHVASFGGFGPLRDPRLTCLVVLDSPAGGGGEAAAPVFGRIMSEALRHLRVPSDEDWLAVSSRPVALAGRALR